MKKTQNFQRNQKSSGIYSMTGYGEATYGKLICRVRSLNHRFLDIKVKLPRSDTIALDMAIRKHLSERIKRGAVEIVISLETGSKSVRGTVDTKQALTAAKTLQELSKKLKTTLKDSKFESVITLDQVLKMPGVLSDLNTENLFSNIEGILENLISPAVKNLTTSRFEEGNKIKSHLQLLLKNMREHIVKIEDLEKPEKNAAREAMIKRAQETMSIFSKISGQQVQNDFATKLHEEAVFFIEKRDFEEERTRFKMHINQVEQLLSKSDQVGRKLEFFQQEMLREVNTLGTKAQSVGIQNHAIELKNILERFREQIANVE